MREYILDDMLRKVEYQKADKTQKRITLLSPEEFTKEIHGISHKKTMLHFLEQLEHTKVELFGSCILGTICVPSKSDKPKEKVRLGFYLQEKQMYLIGEEEQLLHFVGRMKENQFPEGVSMYGFFCGLLNLWIDEDIFYLQKIEDVLSDMEDTLLHHLTADFYRTMVPYRRRLRTLKTYYYELLHLAMTIRSNTNQLLNAEDCLAFGYFADRAGRLHSHVELLQEYILQIREIYQTQIELQQSKAMNLLAVISAIFLPLTLLAGWYGMNFTNMPELSWKWGYPAAILLAVVIVSVEIYIFKKKKLL